MRHGWGFLIWGWVKDHMCDFTTWNSLSFGDCLSEQLTSIYCTFLEGMFTLGVRSGVSK